MSEEAPPLKVWIYPILGRCYNFALVFFVRLFSIRAVRQGSSAITQESGTGLDRKYE